MSAVLPTPASKPGPAQPGPSATDASPAGVFVNAAGATVGAELARWLLATAGRRPARIHLVTGFVTVQGLLQLIEPLSVLLERGHQVRLLLGVAPPEGARIWRHAQLPVAPASAADACPDDPAPSPVVPGGAPAEAEVAPQTMARLCAQADRVLRADLAGMALTGAQLRRLLQLRALLADDRLQVRRYQRGFLHAKTVVVERGERVHAVTGSSNLTVGGLARNQEFNAVLGRGQARAALAAAAAWWRQARPYDLAAAITELFQAHPGELVYLRMLAEAYDDEVNAAASPCMDLADYQRDGVARVRAILRRYGGALIADEVGLGKTYIAGEVARLAVAEGRGPVTVVAPASLRAMWQRRLAEWGLTGVRVLSYHQLTQLHRSVLADGHTWQRCGLLILDEAHAVRNPLTARIQALRSLLAAQPQQPAPPQVLVMSATPVNNTAEDLFELLVLADRTLEPHWQPAAMLQQARLTARSEAGRRLASVLADPLMAATGDKAWYYQMAHARMLRRDRPFIRRAYPAARVRFPRVEQIRVDLPLPTPLRELFAAVLDAVGYADRLPGPTPPGQPPSGPPEDPDGGPLAELAAALAAVRAAHGGRPAELTLAAYRRACYRLHDPGPRPPITGLLRTLLVKRMESSPAALATTADRMAATAAQALTDLDHGLVRITRPRATSRLAALWDNTDDGEALLTDLADTGTATEPASDYHTAALRADLQHDLAILRELAARARAAVPADPKKPALLRLLRHALADDRGPKIVIFASARETTHELGHWLHERIATDPDLAPLRGRVANLGSRHEPPDVGAILAGFAPQTASTAVTEATLPPAADRYDVLICTDKFSEGVNLQQAALCVNYDLTWNPQRLGQRVGRLDRVGSTHDRVTCWTMLPGPATDTVLQIMDALTTKTQVAADTVGVPTALFPDSPVRTYTDLLDLWQVPHPSPTPPPPGDPIGVTPTVHAPQAAPARDHGWATAWLGNARRIPHVTTALNDLPPGAGTIRPGTDPDASVIFCFRLPATPDGPDGRGHRAAFAQVFAGPRRAGHITLDSDRCLRHARIDLTTYLAAGRATGPRPAPTPPLQGDHIELVAALLDQARTAVAQAHGLLPDTAADHIRLVCWMLLTPRTEHPRDGWQ
ncbi:helicase-related protein [Actinomadura sp. 21ATH]|uniref:helicase-related protein n=1 Tax=Actinomadura sp. 21ATH TaxID=1735444 RepID=UPI0035BEE0D1